MDPGPKLFERVPRGLFGPLGDPSADLYWDLLAGLYQHEFEREPFLVTRVLAVEAAERVVRASPQWQDRLRRQDLTVFASDDAASPSNGSSAKVATVEPVDSADAEGTLVREVARRLVARVERCGWIHAQYRAGTGEILSFHPYAARILEALLRVARDEQPVFQGYVHSIASLLDPKSLAVRPGVSLFEAKRNTLDLVRELKILERNIHVFTQRVLEEATTAAAVLEEGLDSYERAVLANYHRLKTVDNVYRQRSAILERLDAFEGDSEALARATEWYAVQCACDPAEARVKVTDDLALMRSQFDEIPHIVEEIDERNARFSGVALRKIRYLLRQDRRTESQLQFIVESLARGETPELEFDMFRCELLADGFLYTPPTERPRARPQALARRPQPDEAKLRREAAARIRRPFARRRVEKYVDDLLDCRTDLDLTDVPVLDDEDYVRLIYIASYGLDGASTFRVVPGEDRVDKAPYQHPGGRIERRPARRTRTEE